MQKLLCLIALLVSAVLCQSSGQQGQVLHVRFVHSVQNGPNVDIYAGSATQSNLLFGSVRALTISPYANLTSGSNGTIIVTEAGNTNNVLITASSLPASGSFTGIISLNQGMTTAFFVNDSLAAPLSQNQSSIRFMFLGTEESFFGTQNQDQTQNQTEGTQGNTTSVAGAYSIQIQNGTTVVMNANLFDKEFERVVLPAGTYTFSILKGNQTVGTIGNVTVVGGRAYTVLVFGSNNGQLNFQVVEDVFAFVVVPSQSSSQSQSQSQTAAGGSAATTGVQSSSQSSQSSQSSSQTQASTVTSGVANTVVIVTGVNRPNIPSSAGSLRVDVAVFGVVCAVLFALFH